MEMTVSIQPVAASGPGAFDEYEITCPCGYEMRSSLLTLARRWGSSHERYHAELSAVAS